ncbi:MAG: peptide deformylase [Christensenellaceae bacterium]|nr:peptide deformylase [Christensenellaceae bacterium]
MALRNILQEGNERLRMKSREVKEITPRILTLLDDMAETMYAADGVGLAAPQVGVLRRIAVIDVGDENGIYELINPVITHQEGARQDQEGCLSCGTRRGLVTRPEKVTVEAQDRDGVWMEYQAEGLLARAMCHEIAHLDGQLFVDIMDRELTDEEIAAMEEEYDDYDEYEYDEEESEHE